MAVKKYHKVLLFLIIFLAVFFRLFNLAQNPPGLYWDEAIYGYDAYSIIKTAHDHNGNFMPLFFESYGDWKMPVYHYLLVPPILVFGLNEFAVRFPSATFGVLTVIVFFYFVKKLTANINLALFASLFLAISPWHIQFSRGGFESNVALFFAVFGTHIFLRAMNSKSTLLFTFSFLLLTLSMYTYHAYRIFTPLLVITLALVYKQQLQKLLKKLIVPVLITLALLLPLINFSLSDEGKARASSQSAFKSKDIEKAKLDFDQKSKKPFRFMSKYLYNPPAYYTYVALKAYVDHMSPTFLFVRGDQIGRHSQVDMGQIYLYEALFLIWAVFAFKPTPFNREPRSYDRSSLILAQNSPRTPFKESSFFALNKLMLFWLILAPLPSIIVGPTPHANRALQMVIPLTYFSALGAYHMIRSKKLRLLLVLVGLFALYSHVSYLHLLFSHYPHKFAADWQSDYKEMVRKLQKHQDSFDAVYITNINQVPYAYVLFYQKYDPEKYIALNGTRDHFDKYYFISRDVNVYDKGRILYIAPSWEKVDGKWLDAVDDASGKHTYSLWELGGQK